LLSRSYTDRFTGALLGLACGDALGAPAEFLSKQQLVARYGHLTEMVGGGLYTRWRPGEWTDDTGMTLCVAEGILDQPDDPVAPIGEKFFDWRAGAKDVGKTIAAALDAYRSLQLRLSGAGDMADWAKASRSIPQARTGRAGGNGSLMRTLPVALAYSDRVRLRQKSAHISAMTHWDPQAEASCLVYCLWLLGILEGAELAPAWHRALAATRDRAAEGAPFLDTPGLHPLPDDFWQRLESAHLVRLEDLQPSGFAGYVLDCLEAAVWCTLNNDDAESAIVEAVNLAGEGDTIAAVTGGIVGAYYGAQTLPDRWLEVLEQRQRLATVGRELAALRHQLVYDKPGLPGFHCHQAAPGVLYGRNPLTAGDVGDLQRAGVRKVLDLRENKEWDSDYLFGREAVAALSWSGIERVAVAIVDGEAPSAEDLDFTWKLLSAADPGLPLYVHCRAGIERTGSVIGAFVARQRGISLHQALDRLAAEGCRLSPLPHQIAAARQWLGGS
jgi:ADP-ribosyl-[dinitrogen reductase] hydrolase